VVAGLGPARPRGGGPAPAGRRAAPPPVATPPSKARAASEARGRRGAHRTCRVTRRRVAAPLLFLFRDARRVTPSPSPRGGLGKLLAAGPGPESRRGGPASRNPRRPHTVVVLAVLAVVFVLAVVIFVVAIVVVVVGSGGASALSPASSGRGGAWGGGRGGRAWAGARGRASPWRAPRRAARPR